MNPCLRVKEFLDANTFNVPGAKMLLKELRERFLQTQDRSLWTTRDFNRDVRRYYPVRESTGNRLYVFNVSFEREANPAPVVVPFAGELRCIRSEESQATFFYLKNRNGNWKKTSWSHLRLLGVTQEQIHKFRKAAVTIADLLAGCKCHSQYSSPCSTNPNAAQP